MTNENERNRFNIDTLKKPQTREQAADYIHEMLGDLIRMAKEADLPPTVPHLLEMAKLEAGDLIKHFSAMRRLPKQG